jgi:hypothetical protein
MFSSRTAIPTSFNEIDKKNTLKKLSAEQVELHKLKNELYAQLKVDGKYIEHKWLNIYSGDKLGYVSCELFLMTLDCNFTPTKDVYDELKGKKKGIFQYLVHLHKQGDEKIFSLLKKVFEDRQHPLSLLFYKPQLFSCDETGGTLKDIKDYIAKHSQIEMKEVVNGVVLKK